MMFFGAVFLVSTTLIMIFKSESNSEADSAVISEPSVAEDEQRLIQDSPPLTTTYKILWRILCLPSVRLLCLFLFTAKVTRLKHYEPSHI